MMLLLDIGNSRVKWGCLYDERLTVGAPALHRGQSLEAVWNSLWSGQPQPQRVVVANVAGEMVASSLSEWCRDRWGLLPEYVSATTEACGVSNGYRKPAQLGVDRWLALIGVRHLRDITGRSACVVGCGTAVTVDVLSVEGHHVGGWIAPGLVLMREQLTQRVAGLSAGVGVVPCVDGFGRETAEAVTAGTRQAAAGLVMQALPLAERLLGHAPVCVLTGGDANELLPLLQCEAYLAPDLVLYGLAKFVRQQELTP